MTIGGGRLDNKLLEYLVIAVFGDVISFSLFFSLEKSELTKDETDAASTSQSQVWTVYLELNGIVVEWKHSHAYVRIQWPCNY